MKVKVQELSKFIIDKLVGSWVLYTPEEGKPEVGRIKSFNKTKDLAFVVYKSNNNWDNYRKYTGEATNVDDLLIIQK